MITPITAEAYTRRPVRRNTQIIFLAIASAKRFHAMNDSPALRRRNLAPICQFCDKTSSEQSSRRGIMQTRPRTTFILQGMAEHPMDANIALPMRSLTRASKEARASSCDADSSHSPTDRMRRAMWPKTNGRSCSQKHTQSWTVKVASCSKVSIRCFSHLNRTKLMLRIKKRVTHEYIGPTPPQSSPKEKKLSMI